MFVFSVIAWFPSGASLFQALPFVLSHGSRNQSIIEFRKKVTPSAEKSRSTSARFNLTFIES